MFDDKSRYAVLRTLERVESDGRHVAYVTRRFVPPQEAYLVAGGLTITDSERIDHVAHRGLGDPAGFWQIADANEAMHPDSLTDTPGRRLVIPVPRAPEASA